MEVMTVDIENELEFICREIETRTYFISPNRVLQLSDVAVRSFDLLNREWKIFKQHMEGSK